MVKIKLNKKTIEVSRSVAHALIERGLAKLVKTTKDMRAGKKQKYKTK